MEITYSVLSKLITNFVPEGNNKVNNKNNNLNKVIIAKKSK